MGAQSVWPQPSSLNELLLDGVKRGPPLAAAVPLKAISIFIYQ